MFYDVTDLRSRHGFPHLWCRTISLSNIVPITVPSGLSIPVPRLLDDPILDTDSGPTIDLDPGLPLDSIPGPDLDFASGYYLLHLTERRISKGKRKDRTHVTFSLRVASSYRGRVCADTRAVSFSYNTSGHPAVPLSVMGCESKSKE
ncbi:hypothetical protein EVAR_6773_1 [Eumeta japonica]|uniref:Uncharacterized protein n=1 Tax=Eumeta variegata TaxID=151549 RepID=A0A4C1V5B7_EUMVA|nr:hypothetical protein EVAR_6773_1 [Eumeta japonica]